MSQRSPEPCRHGGTAPYPRGTDPGARRQTLCDTDRNGAGTRDRLTRNHKSAATQFLNSSKQPFPGESTHEFCQARRRSGIEVTSKLARGSNISHRAVVREEGPRVRIRLPPALSPLRTSFSGGKRGKVGGDDKGRSEQKLPKPWEEALTDDRSTDSDI